MCDNTWVPRAIVFDGNKDYIYYKDGEIVDVKIFNYCLCPKAIQKIYEEKEND
ncbi:hypothetical protein H8D91_01995 [archaeon]|nr:hypothetical protein [archaeon]